MKEIRAECSSCDGSGVYCGFAEPKGVGVVCLTCEGSGCKILRYTPFSERRLIQGVVIVKRSAGVFIGTGVGPYGDSVPYKDFVNGSMPEGK